MSKAAVAVIFCSLALLSMGADVLSSQVRLNAQTDDQNDAAVGFLASQERPETPTKPQEPREKPEEPLSPAYEIEVTVYFANYYMGYEEDSKLCFRIPHDNRIMTGVMSFLHDVCIEVEDGNTYLVFYPTEEESVKVMQLGEDTSSFNVAYDTTTEDFTISQGTYNGEKYLHSNSHIVELMFLMTVYDVYEVMCVDPNPIQAKWLAIVDETYIVTQDVKFNSQECFTPTEGRLADLSICVEYSMEGTATIYVDHVEVKRTEVEGSKIVVEYRTQDDCIRLLNNQGSIVFLVISTEILYVADEGILGPIDSDRTLLAEIEFDPEGPIAQFDCINLYTSETGDYVLASEVNILCVYCNQYPEGVEERDSGCGISIYSKEKESSHYSSFPIIDRKLAIKYETSIEMIHILYGGMQISIYADEIFYFIHTIQEHDLQPIFGEIDSQYKVDTVLADDCRTENNAAKVFNIGGNQLALECESLKCYVGKLDSNNKFSSNKFYDGEITQVDVYAMEDDDFEDTFEYCLSFLTAEGDRMNHCLMKEQVQMYAETLPKFPIFEME